MPHRKLFFSQPLIAVSNTQEQEERYRQFYTQVITACKRRHFIVYDPYEQGHPVKHDFIPESAIYDINRTHILESEIMIAYVGLPSAGVAMEVEIAHSFGLPVILLYEEGRSAQVSKMVRGCPAARYQIQASDLESLAAKLDTQFDTLLEQLYSTPSIPPVRDQETFVSTLTQLREQSGLSFDQIAQRTALDKPYIWRLFKGEIKKPGRNQVVKICAWGLKLSLDQTNTVLGAGGYEPL